jgi:hypothetical protein
VVVRKKKARAKPITTIEMEEAIARKFGVRTNIIVPNVSWGLPGMHECDLFIIKTSGYGVEVEIKISKSDLLADFKKGHSHKDRFNRIKEFYYAFPESMLKSCEELIPKDAGIITCRRSDWGSKLVYASFHRDPVPIKTARKLTLEEQFKVARLGTMRIWTLKNKIIKLNETHRRKTKE